MNSPVRTFPPMLAIAASLLIALALVAAGCGGSSPSDASATTDTTASATNTSTSFAECLEENGVEGFDPGSAPQAGAPPQNVDRAALQKAMQACASLAPEGGGFGGQVPNGRSSEQLAELQSCLKEHGIESFSPGSAQSDADRQKLQAAMQACGGGPGAGGAPPGTGTDGTGGSGSFAAFSRCMRNRGIVLPGAGSGTPTETTSAKYKLAQKACEPLLSGSTQ
jgi:hypothetical protein